MPGPAELALFAQRLEALGAPYMVTGATAAIIYGQPRLTNDLDVVLSLDESGRAALLQLFPEADFYVPPEPVIRAEQARAQRGHFNLIHLESGYKADIYLAGEDPLHSWGLQRIRRIAAAPDLWLSVAPPEYVIIRKLEFYREGGSSKHLTDIESIVAVAGVDAALLEPWVAQLGLANEWKKARGVR